MARVKSILAFLRDKTRKWSKKLEGKNETITSMVPATSDGIPSEKNSKADHVRHELIKKIRAAVEEMLDQARINAKQAFLIDQMVTSLEEVSLMVRSTTSDVGKVLELANHLSKSATDGGQAVENVVSTINNIFKSNEEISKVTENVQMIARESKIISINSMVEAARAGPQGATFMVVAKRIQELAASAADSAAKIDNVTETADAFVREGQNAALSCNDQLASIIGRSSEVNGLIDRLNATMVSQSGMLAELSKVISEVRNDIHTASIKLERGMMTMPSLLDSIEFQSAVGSFDKHGAEVDPTESLEKALEQAASESASLASKKSGTDFSEF